MKNSAFLHARRPVNSILDFHYYLECEGVPKFLGEMAMLRDAYFPKGMLSFLGKLEWGCQNS